MNGELLSCTLGINYSFTNLGHSLHHELTCGNNPIGHLLKVKRFKSKMQQRPFLKSWSSRKRLLCRPRLLDSIFFQQGAYSEIGTFWCTETSHHAGAAAAHQHLPSPPGHGNPRAIPQQRRLTPPVRNGEWSTLSFLQKNHEESLDGCEWIKRWYKHISNRNG